MVQIIEGELAADAQAQLPFIPCGCSTTDSPAAAPVDEPAVVLPADGEVSTLAVVELLLKDERVLNRLLSNPERQRELLPKFMAVAVACFAIYGVVMTGVLNGFVWRGDFWLPHLPQARVDDLSIGNLTAAYTLGLIAANGICLPSFYFYGLLAGLRTTMLAIAAQALKGMASGGLALVGLLPVYLALALIPLVLPNELEIGYDGLALLGLALPFLAGLRGAASLYFGLAGLADTMTPARRAQRECLLRRLILAWVGCFTFVTPVVIYSLWSFLGHWTIAFDI
ncbi:MAG TPA: hypothetical protein VHY91_16450 [Pirellulales bacterium]|nr:hypothetical protein [Pirellulales bacterium]